MSIAELARQCEQALEKDKRIRRFAMKCRDAARAAEGGDLNDARAALEKAALILLNMEPSMQSQATVFEASTESLVSELKRRAREENDAKAKRALKPIIRVPVKSGAR